MAIKEKKSVYEIMLLVAYGFYMLVGLLFLAGSLYWGKLFNYWAFSLFALFASQAYLQHRLTNLILGIPILAISIFFALQFISMDKNVIINSMLGISLSSIVLSIIMIFGYLKMSFKENR